MIVTIEEMNTVVDEYKLQQITDNNDDITRNCIRAAESRTLSYLMNRYSIDKIRELPADAPALADLKEIIKIIALYNLLQRHNIDMHYSSVFESYKLQIEYLEKVASGKVSLIGLPSATSEDGTPVRRLEMGSRDKADFRFY